MRASVVLLVLVGVACQGTQRDDAPPPTPDTTIDPGTCTLGSPDHCGTCDTRCPGDVALSTLRTCSSSLPSGTCGINCRGEFYDVDGDIQNGCEAEDLPLQPTSAKAVLVSLPGANNGGSGNMPCNGMTNPCTVASQVYGDMRIHVAAPENRPLGREDWYKVTAVGVGTAGMMIACLGIGSFPADNRFEVCIGNAGSANPTTCMTTSGQGAAACVAPPTAADSGDFYIKIRKTAGSNTRNKYYLFLSH